MDRNAVMRGALWATAPLNIGAACLFAFPASALGQLAGLPASAPALYRLTVALFVALFGGAYAWLALHRRFDRPLVALAALGKAAFATTVLSLWVFNAAPTRLVILASGDLVFAAIFAWWLWSEPA